MHFSKLSAVRTGVRGYMEASLLVRLTPICAKDDDSAPVRQAIWKPTPKIFGVPTWRPEVGKNIWNSLLPEERFVFTCEHSKI